MDTRIALPRTLRLFLPSLTNVSYKIVLLGDTYTGKTCLVLRFVEGNYKGERDATIGAFFLTKRLTIHQNYTCKLLLWDTAGQAPFQKLAATYYKDAQAAILCFDLSRPESLERVKEQLLEIQLSIVICLCGCKGDLPIASGIENEARHLAEQYGAFYIRTSAKRDENVRKLFEQVSRRVLEQHKIVIGTSPDEPHRVSPIYDDGVTEGGAHGNTSPLKTTTTSLQPSGVMCEGSYLACGAQDRGCCIM